MGKLSHSGTIILIFLKKKYTAHALSLQHTCFTLRINLKRAEGGKTFMISCFTRDQISLLSLIVCFTKNL